MMRLGRRARRLAFAVSLPLLLPWISRCAGQRSPVTPVPTKFYRESNEPAPCFVVFLPGQRDRLGAFGRHGFPRVVGEAGLSTDMVEVDLHRGYYENESMVRRLDQDVIAPARCRGYRQVWLLGISMGGFGALAYAKAHPRGVAGLVLLAPFLGEEQTVAEIAAVGLRQWTPKEGRGPEDFTRRLWRWLKQYADSGAAELPPIYLGYGTRDELALSNRLLAEVLPPDQVATAEVGHTWSVWQQLFRQLLQSGALRPGCAER